MELLRNVKNMAAMVSFSVVIYESTVRLDKILSSILDIFGEEARLSLAIDLTKVSEKVFRGNVVEIMEMVKSKKLKGEATLVLSIV